MNFYSWLLIPALMVAFGCSTSTYYRIRHDRTPLAWSIIAFSLLTFGLLMVYVIVINPFPQPRLVTFLFAGLALILFLMGIGLMLFIPGGTSQRLSLHAVRALLPESILELTPEQMRSLLPERFHGHAAHEIQMFVMIQLTEMSPQKIRSLTPQNLQAVLRRNIPRSILDSK